MAERSSDLIQVLAMCFVWCRIADKSDELRQSTKGSLRFWNMMRTTTKFELVKYTSRRGAMIS